MTEALLPESLRAIADIIGAPAALKIAGRWGGQRLYVPAGVDEDHELAKLIGLDAARALADAYAGERVEVPKADCWGRAIKYQIIREARANGQSQARLAREHGYTERQIRNIERRLDGDDWQGDLF